MQNLIIHKAIEIHTVKEMHTVKEIHTIKCMNITNRTYWNVLSF
ncbi:MAG: hypothetical protein K0S47_2547 [Herbinix sp.]|jgi:hypothetical protein|nr:hypothetical protein [Herbinix sp.]